MKQTYLGHAAFLLGADGKSVLVDPFPSGNPAATGATSDFAPETILLSHADDDHLGDTVAIARRVGSTVIATVELATWLGQRGVEGATPADHGGTIAFDGGSTELVPAWRTSAIGDTVLAPGEPAGHVVRFGGRTVPFAGDHRLFGDMALIGEVGLDVAVPPIGDRVTMGSADAARAARLLGAPTVIPGHDTTLPPPRRAPAAT